MKIGFKKAVSVTVILSLVTGLFCSCDFNGNGNDGNIPVFADVKADGAVEYSSNGEFSVNITADGLTFDSEIFPDEIEIFYPVISYDKLTDVDAVSGIKLSDDEYTTVYSKVSEVTVASPSAVQISFTDELFVKNCPDFYFIAFDENTNENKKKLIAAIDVSYPGYLLISDTPQISSDSNINTFKLTLDKSSFSSDISAEDIILSGAFKDCTVQSFVRTGDTTVSVTLAGDINGGYSNGSISVKSTAVLNSAFDVSAVIQVISPEILFVSDDFEISDSYARFYFVLKDCRFADNVTNEMFSVTGEEMKIDRFERTSASEGMLYVSFEQKESVDDAVEALCGCTFRVDSSALNISVPLTFGINADETDVNAEIQNVVQSKTEITVTASLSVVNGSFNVISKNSFVFGGDFAKASITSISAQDKNATITLSVPKASSSDKVTFYATIGLKSGALSGFWGQPVAISAFPLYYNENETEQTPTSPDIERLCAAIELLAEYTSTHTAFDFEDLNALLNSGFDDGTTFGEFCDEFFSSYSTLYSYYENSDSIVNALNLSSSDPLVQSDRLCVNDYLYEAKALYSAQRSISDSFARLLRTIPQIKECTDAQEMETLLGEYNRLTNDVLSVYKMKIKGKPFTETLNSLCLEYTAQSGVAMSFDILSQSQHNWYPQIAQDKLYFTYYSKGIAFSGAFISLFSMAFDPEGAMSGGEYASVSKSLSRISDYKGYDSSDMYDEQGVYSTTLKRLLKLRKLDLNSKNLPVCVTSAEIAQLSMLLSDEETLMNELESVGFVIGNGRYIVCNDFGISASFKLADNKSNTERIYSFVRKATVYDLILSKSGNDFVYLDCSFKVYSDDGEIKIQPYINKKYGVMIIE